MRVTTKKILKTSVNVDSIIKLDFVLSDIDIESDKGITTAGEMLAMIKPRNKEFKKENNNM